MVPKKSDLTSRVETEIIEVLKKLQEPYTPRDLIDKLVAKDLSDVLIREAIWHLIDHKKIKLTEDLKLQAA